MVHCFRQFSIKAILFLSFAESGLASRIQPLLGGMLADVTESVALAQELPMMSLTGLVRLRDIIAFAAEQADGVGEPSLVKGGPAH